MEGIETESVRDDVRSEPGKSSGSEQLAVANILLRDVLAARQRLFSYLQVYLTAQAGLAALFGFVAHDSYEMLQLPSARIVLVISMLGLFASFVVIAYGLLTLRPGRYSAEWISDCQATISSLADVSRWAAACQQRLEQLLAANSALSRRITWIRLGVLIQLACGFAAFLLALRF